jgi:hypothetical protein
MPDTPLTLTIEPQCLRDKWQLVREFLKSDNTLITVSLAAPTQRGSIAAETELT